MDAVETWPTGRLLSAAARLVEHEWNTHLAKFDLNHASLAVLHVLLAGSMTQRELAAAVQVEDQTMSRTVAGLERSGYVERHRDPGDRRRVVVSLTEDGRRTVLRASDIEVAEGYFTDAVDDVQTLRRALIAVIERRSRARWPEASGHPAGEGADERADERTDEGAGAGAAAPGGADAPGPNGPDGARDVG